MAVGISRGHHNFHRYHHHQLKNLLYGGGDMPVGLNTLRDHAMVHTGAFHLLGKEHCYDANKNDDDYQCWENDDDDDG